MALLFLYALVQHPIHCQERPCMFGFELTSFLKGAACACISHSFSKHWSITGEVSVAYHDLVRGRSAVELEHDEEFSDTNTLGKDIDTHSERALISYWPAEAFRGFNLSAGIHSGSSSGIDIITEAGYTFHIWKGINIQTAFRIPLIQGIRTGSIGAHNINIKLQYRF